MRYLYITLLSLSFITLTSCSKLLDEQPPASKLSSKQVFKYSSTAEEAIVGLYVSIPHAMTSNQTIFWGMYADELIRNSGSEEENQFQASFVSDNNGLVQSLWSQIYGYIYLVNSCIDGLQSSQDLPDILKKQLLGESLFFRAMSYFYLTNYFGDVPLVLDSDYEKNAFLPRTNVVDVHKKIIEDLENSISLLSQAKLKDGQAYRINAVVSKAFLARVHLNFKNWEQAALISDEVLRHFGNPDLPPINGVFFSTGTEAIFKFMPHQSSYLHIGIQEVASFVPANKTSIPTYILSQSLLTSFETGDARFLAWIGYNTINGVDYYYPAKYKNRKGEFQKEDYQFLRLSEQYLIRAESNAHLENLSTAVQDLNQVRKRAQLSLIQKTDAELDKAELLSLILDENRHEFFLENGHRWSSLKRNNQVGEALHALKGGWEDFRLILPIPQLEIELNKKLEQNEKY